MVDLKPRSVPGRTILFGAHVVLSTWTAVAAFLAPAAVASPAEQLPAQYVLLVDDSGSMSRTIDRLPATDPDRLAVFAVDSLLSLLDDRDEATVLRLGAKAAREEPLPLQPLSANRQALRDMLRLDGALAAYDARSTDCRGGFEQAARVLNDAWRPGVSQVFLFLTDGDCTAPLDVRGFLKGVDSHHREGRLQFYPITFQGRPSSRELKDIASGTGGASYAIAQPDPTQILEPFARAVSRSQGYDTYMLSPANVGLSAHSAARRVRLLAVAPGPGAALDLTVRPEGPGAAPQLDLSRRAQGTHRYQEGQTFRFTRLDYRPGTAAVSVSVNGAGSDWKVVAIPEYRFHLRVRVVPGACTPDAGERGDVQGVEVGGAACVVLDLVNDEGQPVPVADLGRPPELGIHYTSPGATASQALPARSEGPHVYATLERRNLGGGDHLLQPYARFQSSAGVTEMRGAARTLQASSRTVTFEPAALEIGTLSPGASLSRGVQPRGNFSATTARVTVVPADALPRCVSLSVAGKPVGEPFPFLPDNPVDVRVGMGAFCGPSVLERPLGASLRFEFDPASGMPSRELPLDGNLAYRIRAPTELVAEVRAGENLTLDVPLDVGAVSGASASLKIAAVLRTGAEWPADDLGIGFLGGTGPEGREGLLPTQGAPGTLMIRPSACCAGGEYRAELVLGAPEGDASLVVPVRLHVAEASALACYGRRAAIGVSGLLVVLFLWRIVRMFQNTHMIKPGLVVLKPMYSEGGSGPTVDTKRVEAVRGQLAESLGLTARLKALWAVPPLYTLVRGSYHHTVEISLDTRRAEVRYATPATERDLWQRSLPGDPGHEPPATPNALYLSADSAGGAMFWAVVDHRMKIGSFKIQDSRYIPPNEGQKKCISLKRGTLLLVEREDDDSSARKHIGWSVG